LRRWRRLGPVVRLAKRDRPWQRIGGSRLACGNCLARRGGAYDVGLDHDVARPADHQQVLDIVATDQDQPTPAVDGGCVDDGKPRLAPARGGGAQVSGAEAPHQPCGQSDQAEHHDEGEQESEAILPFAEQEIQHMLLPAPEGGWAFRSGCSQREQPGWLTPAAIFAAGIPNKILKLALL
jgi:hypothetical protein